MSTHGIGPRLIPQLSDGRMLLAICAATERDPTSARAGRAVAFFAGSASGVAPGLSKGWLGSFMQSGYWIMSDDMSHNFMASFQKGQSSGL